MDADRRDGAQKDKIALVLAGGGVLGAAYEVGALLALEQQFPGLAANGFDQYVGTSAGALLVSLLANGVTAMDLLRILQGEHPRLRALDASDVFALDGPGLLWPWALGLPAALLRASTRLWPPDLPRVLMSLSEALPAGLFDSAGLERFLRETLSRVGGTNRFQCLAHELYIIATNLHSGQRAVFEAGHPSGVSIARAVAASAALPLVYKPVRIGRNVYVDGGLRGNASLDVAAARGARLIICLNALAPYAPPGDEVQGDTSLTAAAVAGNALRIVAHAGLHQHIENVQRRYPDVDIICVEPAADEAPLSQASMLDYSERQHLAQSGYRSAWASLAQRRPALVEMLGRHGIEAASPAPESASLWRPDTEPWSELNATLNEIESWVPQDPAPIVVS